MGIKGRMNRLGSSVKRCPVCNYPGPPPKGREVKIDMRGVRRNPETGEIEEYDPETGEILEPRPPRYCPGCGRELPVIRVKGMPDKPRNK